MRATEPKLSSAGYDAMILELTECKEKVQTTTATATATATANTANPASVTGAEAGGREARSGTVTYKRSHSSSNFAGTVTRDPGDAFATVPHNAGAGVGAGAPAPGGHFQRPAQQQYQRQRLQAKNNAEKHALIR